MSKCSECTYLNTNNTNLYGKYWCEECKKYVFLNNDACDRFSWETARQSFLEDEYNKFLNNGNDCCSSIMAICSILKMPENNNMVANIRDLIKAAINTSDRYMLMIAEYGIFDSEICSCLNKDPMKYKLSLDLFFKYIEPINSLIRACKYEDAINRYTYMTKTLKELYRIDSNSIKDENKVLYK